MERFTDLKNGIIRDETTGLEWQADPLLPASWQEQMDEAARLDLGGHTDWRLPTIEELITLLDYSRENPASTFPRQSSGWFWSSSSYAYDVSLAWVVTFNDGNVSDYDKVDDFYTRCVRGGPSFVGSFER